MRRLLLLVLTLSLSLPGARSHRIGGRGAPHRASGTTPAADKSASCPTGRTAPPPLAAGRERGQPAAVRPGQRDRGDAVRRDHGRLRPRRQARPGPAAAVPTRRDRAHGIKVPVVFEHSPYRYNAGGAPTTTSTSTCCRRRVTAEPGRSAAAARRREGGPGPARIARQLLGAARLRGGAGREHRHRLLRRLPDDRRPERDARHQGDHRLAQRPGAGVERGGRAGHRRLDHRRRRHDRRLLQRHAAQPVATTGVDGLRTIVPVSAISSWYDYYRANGLVRAPHSDMSGAGERFPGRGPRRAGGVRRRAGGTENCRDIAEEMLAVRTGSPATTARTGTTATTCTAPSGFKASVFVVHGLEDYNVMPKAFTSWWEQLERTAYRARSGCTRRHGGPRHLGLPADAEPVDGPLALRRPERHHVRAAGRRAATGRHVREVRRLAGAGYPGWTLHLGATNATEPGTLSPAAAPGPRPRQSFVDRGASSTPTCRCCLTRTSQPEPAGVPVAAAALGRPPERHAVGVAAGVGGQPLRGQPDRGARRLRPAGSTAPR